MPRRRIEIERLAAPVQADQPERHRQRQRQQNRKRMHQVLVLGRQHDVHEHERQGERPHEILQRPLQLAAAAQHSRFEAGRNADFLGRGLQGVDAVGEGIAGRNIGPNGDHPLPVEPVDAGRRFAVLERHDIVDPRQNRGEPITRLLPRRPRAAADWPAHKAAKSTLHRGDRGRQPQLDVVGVIDRHIAIARDAVVAADRHPQRLGNLAGIDAQRRRPLAIDVHQQLRLIHPQRRIDIDEALRLAVRRVGIDRIPQLSLNSFERRDIGPVMEKSISTGAPCRSDVRFAHRLARRSRILLEQLPHFGHLVALREVAAKGRVRIAVSHAPPTSRASENVRVSMSVQPHVHLGPVDAAKAARADGRQQQLDARESRAICASSRCSTSSIDARLAPSGA